MAFSPKKVLFYYIIIIITISFRFCWWFLFALFHEKRALRKADIIKKFQNDLNLMSYIPDDIKINSLNRDFLISVLMTGNQGKYFDLYKQYKDILSQKDDKRLQKYMLPISEELKNKLRGYNPVDTYSYLFTF